MTNASGVVRFVVPIVLMVAVAALVGCAPAEQATVSGKVTIDGRPLDRGVVTFVNALGKSTAGISGQIHSDGTYDVQIGQSGEIVAGEYNVIVDSREASAPQPEGAPPLPGELLIPVRYTRVETSGLRYHVRSGTNVIDIALAGEKTGVADESADTDKSADIAEATGAPMATEGAQEGGKATSGSPVEAETSTPAAVEEEPKSSGDQP